MPEIAHVRAAVAAVNAQIMSVSVKVAQVRPDLRFRFTFFTIFADVTAVASDVASV
jgi:hypothetical protein